MGKVVILKRHLVELKNVSNPCNAYQLHSKILYW
jgi:hypothetical protein